MYTVFRVVTTEDVLDKIKKVYHEFEFSKHRLEENMWCCDVSRDDDWFAHYDAIKAFLERDDGLFKENGCECEFDTAIHRDEYKDDLYICCGYDVEMLAGMMLKC